MAKSSEDSKSESSPPELNSEVVKYREADVWTVSVLVRSINALTLATFFQPDEFFQALEPGWALAFGLGEHAWRGGAYDGPWLTWEWTNQLRSSIMPVLFAGIYQAIDYFCNLFFPPLIRTKLILLGPRAVGGLFGACIDWYTWRFAEKIYGAGSMEATAAIGLSLFSPWQWYVSTRTLSNTLETALTVGALYYWPWSWFRPAASQNLRAAEGAELKYSLILAALACVLRPTNVIIWVILTAFTLPKINQKEFISFIRDASIFGSIVLVASSAVDYWYYEEVTFPAFKWFEFNFSKDLAVFYGTNRIDYYFTEAIPILLNTMIPVGVIALTQAFAGSYRAIPIDQIRGALPLPVLRTLATVSMVFPLILSFVAHKEVRFIYPILPILYVLMARPWIAFWDGELFPSPGLKRLVVYFLLATNGFLAFYLGFLHQRAPIEVLDFLRTEFENKNPEMQIEGKTTDLNATTVAFLMPCHSTPWRSHLVYSDIHAWALTCEPPIDMNATARATYEDEADQFYSDTKNWIYREFTTRQRIWPEYLVFFEQLQPALDAIVHPGNFKECYRGFNGFWHEDWRRRGDLIVWCKEVDMVAFNKAAEKQMEEAGLKVPKVTKS